MTCDEFWHSLKTVDPRKASPDNQKQCFTHWKGCAKCNRASLFLMRIMLPLAELRGVDVAKLEQYLKS